MWGILCRRNNEVSVATQVGLGAHRCGYELSIACWFVVVSVVPLLRIDVVALLTLARCLNQ